MPLFDGYLFDIDGVICLGSTPVPGVDRVLKALQGQHKKVMFVSNTSSRSEDQVLRIFRDMGVPVSADDIFIASEQTARHLSRLKPNGDVYVIGSAGLQQALARYPLNVLPATERQPRKADFVVIGKDTKLTYDKLTCALRALQQGSMFVAINEDMTVPAEDGLEPGAGAIVASLQAMCGRKPDISIGKPAPFLFEKALAHAQLPAQRCLMIGDTLEADIAGAQQLGMPTALVTTGNFGSFEATCSGALPADITPDWTISSLAALIAEL